MGQHPGAGNPSWKRAATRKDRVWDMTWGNILEQWILTLERGHWQTKAGSSSRNRVYPDSHPGISGVIRTLTQADARYRGNPDSCWGFGGAMAGSSGRVCSDTHWGVSGHPRFNPPGSRSQPGAPVLLPELGAPSPSAVPGRAGPQQVRGLPAPPPPALPLPAEAATEASQSPGGSFPSPADVRGGPYRS